MNAAKARLDGFGQRLAELGDGQARGVAGDDRALGHKGRDLVVEVGLPVHALGDGLDDQVALFQNIHVFFVVGLLDQGRIFGHAQRRGLELFQALNGLDDDAVLRAFLGGQVEQHHRHLDIDQMGGDLRAHHAGTEHGDFFNLEARYG